MPGGVPALQHFISNERVTRAKVHVLGYVIDALLDGSQRGAFTSARLHDFIKFFALLQIIFGGFARPLVIAAFVSGAASFFALPAIVCLLVGINRVLRVCSRSIKEMRE